MQGSEIDPQAPVFAPAAPLFVSAGPVFVSAEAVAQSVDLHDVIAVLRRTYAAQPVAAQPVRGAQPETSAQPAGEAQPLDELGGVDVRNAGRVVARGPSGARIRALAAVLPTGDILGAKLHAQPADGNSAFLIAIFDQGDGRLLGLMDGRAITQLRTGATSSLALDALAPPGPLDLAVLGSGVEARSHLRAVATLRPLSSVRVFSTTAQRRERFAAELSAELSTDIDVCTSAEEAVTNASAVIAAARSHGELPVFDPAALSDGTVIVSVGSTVPEQRELHERVLERAALIVADEPAELLEQSGDCIAASRANIELADKTHSLAELIQGTIPVPIDGRAITIFKSVGSALQDLAVAGLVLQRALATGRTTPIDISLTPKERRG